MQSSFDRILVGSDDEIIYSRRGFNQLKRKKTRRDFSNFNYRQLVEYMRFKIGKHNGQVIQGMRAHFDGHKCVYDAYPDHKYSIENFQDYINQTNDESKTWLEWIRFEIDEENKRIQAEIDRVNREAEERVQKEREEQERLRLQKEEKERAARQKQLENEERMEKTLVDLVNDLKLQQDGKFAIAFSGIAKMGKSSLINGIRGLLPGESGAAEVEITEATQKIQEYIADYGSEKLNLYDLPGSNTPSHKADEYYAEKALNAYDCLLIFLNETMTVKDASFALEALKNKKLVVFVKSYMDLILEDMIQGRLIDKNLPIQEQANLAVTKYKEIYWSESNTMKILEQIEDTIHRLNNISRDKIDLKNVKFFCVSWTSMYYFIAKRPVNDEPISRILFEEEKFIQFLVDKTREHKNRFNNFQINLLKFPTSEQFYTFNINDFEEQKLIGKTIQSEVKQYKYRPLNFNLAVKIINLSHMQESLDRKNLEKLMKEAWHLQCFVNSPNIVEFYGLCKHHDQHQVNLLICIELMAYSLEELYRQAHTQSKKLPENIIGQVNVSILDALSFCKAYKIYHRDVKPKNILVDHDGRIKLCDFGEAKLSEDSLHSTAVGTMAYWPPEDITIFMNTRETHRYHGSCHDIWSIGITLAEIAYGKFPYKEFEKQDDNMSVPLLQNLIQIVTNLDTVGLISRCLEGYSDRLKQFVTECLQPLDKRPKTYAELKKMEFYISNKLNLDEVAKFIKDIHV